MVIKLKYIAAREVQTTLRALRIVNPQGGNLAGIEGSNTILITDFAPNVKRIYEVIKLMDQEGPQKQFRVVRLRYAVAEDIVEQLREFAKTNSRRRFGTGPNLEEIKLIVDKRLNAVVIEAYQAKMRHMINLIKELDQKLAENPGMLHYVRLKHADAVKLQETLSKLVESGGFKGDKNKGKTTSSSRDTNQIPLSIEAEPQTNALIVRAEEHQWQEVKRIIAQVDVRRAQVLIEAAVVEISPEDALNLGVEIFWADEARNNKVGFTGGSNFGLSNLVVVDGDTAKAIDTSGDNTGKKYGKLPASREGAIGALTYDDLFTIPVLLNALQTQGDVKILSIPRILANDNEQAQIKVSDQDPTTTSSTSSGGNDVTGFSGYQEAGTTLTITPHISGEGNYLRLNIEQVIEEFVGVSQVVGNTVVPRGKRSRRLYSSVTIPNGHTVAIGGLTFDSLEENISKIPLLGDLPLIGILFQTRVVTHRKRNIYLFLTPHILRDPKFKDLLQKSHELKLHAQKAGVNVAAFDKSFEKYQKKYELDQKNLEPLYLMEYESPLDESEDKEKKKQK